MHHRKLNLRQPISSSSGSRASVFIIGGVICEGPEEVSCLISPTSLIYSSKEIFWASSIR